MEVQLRQFIGEHDWGWIQQRSPILRVEDTCGIMAINMDTNTTIAACIMDSWTPNSVQCHLIIDNPLAIRHGFLDCCFDFIFRGQGVKYIFGLVPADNEKAVKLNTHLGFTIKARLDEAFKDECDYLIMQLKKEDCIFLRSE